MCHQCNSNATWNSDTMKCECNSGYRPNWNFCTKISEACWNIPFTCEDDYANITNTGIVDNKYTWLCEWSQCSACLEGYVPEGDSCVQRSYQVCYDADWPSNANFYVVGGFKLPFELNIQAKVYKICTPTTTPPGGWQYDIQEILDGIDYVIETWHYRTNKNLPVTCSCGRNFTCSWSNYDNKKIYTDSLDVTVKGKCKPEDLVKPMCKRFGDFWEGYYFEWSPWTLYSYYDSLDDIFVVDNWYTGSIVSPDLIDSSSCPVTGDFLNVEQSELLDNYLTSLWENLDVGDVVYVYMPCVADSAWLNLTMTKKEKNITSPTAASYRYYEISEIKDDWYLYNDCEY